MEVSGKSKANSAVAPIDWGVNGGAGVVVGSGVESTLILKGKSWNDFRLIFVEQLLGFRSMWFYLVVFQAFLPLALIFACGHFGGINPTATQVIQIVSGSITFTLANVGLMSMAGRVNYMRQNGTLLHYYSLPISKVSFVSALLVSRIIFLIPSLVVPILAANFIYRLDTHLDLWLLPIIVIGAFVMAAIGTVMGATFSNPEMVSFLTTIISFIVFLASPAFIPADILPLPLQILGWMLPTTYISNLLVHSFNGLYDLAFVGNFVVLGVMLIIALFFIAKVWRWRAD